MVATSTMFDVEIYAWSQTGNFPLMDDLSENGTSCGAVKTLGIPIDAAWPYLYYEVVSKSSLDSSTMSYVRSKFDSWRNFGANLFPPS
jgi:hypothetical protein